MHFPHLTLTDEPISQQIWTSLANDFIQQEQELATTNKPNPPS